MKIAKLLILTILSLSFSISFTFANRINILDTKGRNFDINKQQIDQKLEEIQDKYGLNIDVVVLGEDKENCYLDSYYYNCIQDKYTYTSDMIINIKKKLSDTDRGDINTLREDKFEFLINTYTLNQAQDEAIPFLKQEDLNRGIGAYLTELDNQIKQSCDTIYDSYEASYKQVWEDAKITKLSKSCNVFDLKDIHTATLTINEDIINKRKKETTKKIIIFMIIGIISLFGLYFLYTKFQVSRYTNKLKDMLKDIKFYKMELENKDTFFPDAKKELNDDILSIEEKIERYLGDIDKNRKLLKQQYELFVIEKEELSKKREKAIYDYTHQDELQEDINEFKKRDL